ncbi:MAG: nucleoside triphosphate pyrophosphohydrolase [Desulfomonilaceae bacterium]|nr:nucleoside triphosphate pyrophosphohydrolase [Desulfomonilaceae bacterium]
MIDSTVSTDGAEMFGKLITLIRILRSENGCPWDKEQTPQSFHPYILEEYHEMVHAMNQGDKEEIADEMGDLIFLVIFVAYMFEQQGLTTLKDVVEGVIEKMTRRHPHVFGDATATNSGEVIDKWREIKAGERNISRRDSILDGVPRSLPALSRAQKLAGRAAKVGFDWTRPEDVFDKIDEELNELRDAVSAQSSRAIREELGDLLFVIVNAGRHLKVNSEAALNDTSDKFERRFRFIESGLKAQGRSLEDADLKEMDRLWDEAKNQEHTRS